MAVYCKCSAISLYLKVNLDQPTMFDISKMVDKRLSVSWILGTNIPLLWSIFIWKLWTVYTICLRPPLSIPKKINRKNRQTCFVIQYVKHFVNSYSCTIECIDKGRSYVKYQLLLLMLKLFLM